MTSAHQFSGRLLGAFLTLAETGQFRLAADRLAVSQSAFSQMIARLEAQLGARLFDRDTRRVSLTPEGELLLPTARLLASGIEAMYADMRALAEQRTGKVAVAALPSLCTDWLPRIFAEFRRARPGIRLQLFDAVAEPNLEMIRRGAVDFAINAVDMDREEFDTRVLFHERYVLVCPPDHPLARRAGVSLRDLDGVDYVHTLKSGSLWRWIEPHVRDLELRDTGFEVTQLATLAGLVANGVGVSLVPGFAVPQFRRLGLATVPVRDRAIHRPLMLVTRRGQSLSVAAQALVEAIGAHRPSPAEARLVSPAR